MFIYIVYIAFASFLRYHTKEVKCMADKMFISKIKDDVYISQLSLPGTHDSCANNVNFSDVSRCQESSVSHQLQRGIRVFDIRLSFSNGRYPLVHYLADCYVYSNTKYKLYFEYVFSIIKNFLRKNPKEFVVLIVKEDRGIMKNSFAKYFIKKFINTNKDILYLENKIPMLSEVKGKIVLLRRFSCPQHLIKKYGIDSLGIDLSHWENQNTKKPFPFSRTNINVHDRAVIQDSYNINKEDKWEAEIKPFLEISYPNKNMLYLNWLNTSGAGETPRENSKFVNEKFFEYLNRSGSVNGWFLIDFPTDEIIDKIIESNFKKKFSIYK